MDQRLLSSKQAALYLGVSLRTLRNLISARKVPTVRLSDRLLRFDVKDLEKFIQTHRLS